MIQLITPDRYGEFTEALAEMYRLRYRVFKERLDWDVQVSGGMEMDEFDALHPAYLLQRRGDGRIQGCVRLLPSTGPTMLGKTFAALLDGAPPADATVWESSRFAVDLDRDKGPANRGIAKVTYELFAGMIEFGLWRRLSAIMTVTDVRMERILRRAGWPLRRFGCATTVDDTVTVAGYLEISHASLTRVRGRGGFDGPALWMPVALAAA
ncbi:MAG: acyl-homoserine-lactone synthase [Gammaproteobacteria bacterium]